jgi:hypothetical protein
VGTYRPDPACQLTLQCLLCRCCPLLPSATAAETACPALLLRLHQRDMLHAVCGAWGAYQVHAGHMPALDVGTCRRTHQQQMRSDNLGQEAQPQ